MANRWRIFSNCLLIASRYNPDWAKEDASFLYQKMMRYSFETQLWFNYFQLKISLNIFSIDWPFQKWKKSWEKISPTGIEPATSRAVLKVVHRTVCKAQCLHEWQRGLTQCARPSVSMSGREASHSLKTHVAVSLVSSNLGGSTCGVYFVQVNLEQISYPERQLRLRLMLEKQQNGNRFRNICIHARYIAYVCQTWMATAAAHVQSPSPESGSRSWSVKAEKRKADPNWVHREKCCLSIRENVMHNTTINIRLYKNEQNQTIYGNIKYLVNGIWYAGTAVQAWTTKGIWRTSGQSKRLLENVWSEHLVAHDGARKSRSIIINLFENCKKNSGLLLLSTFQNGRAKKEKIPFRAKSSRSWSVHVAVTDIGAYCMNNRATCPPGGASVESRLDGMTI